MKYDVLDEVKLKSPFKRADVFLYVFLLVLTVFLFVIIFAVNDKKAATAFIATHGEERVFVYDKQSGFKAESGNFDITYVKTGSILTVTVTGKDGEYNVLEIDEANFTIKVVDANCSFSKDCVHMASIGEGGGFIYCLPHDLKIIAVGNGDITDVPIG